MTDSSTLFTGIKVFLFFIICLQLFLRRFDIAGKFLQHQFNIFYCNLFLGFIVLLMLLIVSFNFFFRWFVFNLLQGNGKVLNISLLILNFEKTIYIILCCETTIGYTTLELFHNDGITDPGNKLGRCHSL